MENGELWCALCALIEIISELKFLNSQFSILNSPIAALNNKLLVYVKNSQFRNRVFIDFNFCLCYNT